MDKVEKSKWAGRFTVPPGRDVYGELTLSGARTSLYLQDNDHFTTHALPGQYIKGVLHDLTKISLISCITTSGPGSATRGEESYQFATVFPHFVVYGDNYLGPDEKTIVEVHFVIDDASTLFYDFDAFGFLIDARPFIEKIANANCLPRKIQTGPDPEILYFTGKTDIFSVDTVLGKVSASHNPSHNVGGPDGVRLKNTILVTIVFKEPVIFEDSIFRTSTLLRYLEMLVGRPQNLLSLNLRAVSDEQKPVFLQVHWSMPPKRESSQEGEKPHPSDVLLDAVRQPEEFSDVLANWLDREHDWRDARLRFSNSFAEQNHYSIDRLIGSANMFDILPSSAVPSDVQLSDELKTAKETGCKTFRALSESPERDSVLGALGRIGKANLKQKIRHRARRIIEAIGERFPELSTVTDEAVNCRNYYVHGSEPRFDYSGNLGTVNFFTDTLEFVFAASDLIEAGWDVKSWSNVGTTMSHPFARFRVSYAPRLQELKGLLRSKTPACVGAADGGETSGQFVRNEGPGSRSK